MAQVDILSFCENTPKFLWFSRKILFILRGRISQWSWKLGGNGYTLYIPPEDGVRTWQKDQGIDYDLLGSSDSKILGYWLKTYQVAQMVKKILPAMWENQVQSLGCEGPLEKEMATYPSILAWRMPWTEDSGRLQFMGVTKNQTWLRNLHDSLLTMTEFAKWKPELDPQTSWITFHYLKDGLIRKH